MEPLGLPQYTGPLDALLYLAGLPGEYLRGALGGKPGKKMAGREMLEERKIVGPNTDQGWIPDKGDVAGFAADMILDPTNAVGVGALAKTGKVRKVAKAANAKSEKLRKMGAMPEEIVEKLHPSMLDETGKPLIMRHGTKKSGLEAKDLDPKFSGTQTDPGFLGKGVYFSQKPENSNYYTDSDMSTMFPELFKHRDSGSTVMAYVDSRNPFHFDFDKTGHMRDALPELSGMTENAIEGNRTVINDALKARGHDAVFATGSDPQHFEVMVPKKSQIYAPYVAPKLREIPSIDDQIQMLLLHNASKANTMYDL